MIIVYVSKDMEHATFSMRWIWINAPSEFGQSGLVVSSLVSHDQRLSHTIVVIVQMVDNNQARQEVQHYGFNISSNDVTCLK